MSRLLITSGLVGILILQDSPELERLIASLGNESVEERQKAEDRLIELGPKALPALRKVAAGADQEVRGRAQSAIDDIERLERERQHDAAEKERLLIKRRKDADKKAEKEPGAVFTGAARFELSAIAFQKGLALHTDAVNYMYVENRMEEVSFDVVDVQNKDGKTLEIERCGRCSPGTILVKDTAGPLRVHVKGTHRWYSRHLIEFKAPKNGDQKKVGDFTIQVDWPILKTTSRRAWPKDVMDLVGTSFTFEVKEGVTQPIFGGFGGGSGGHFGGVFSSKWWCGCKGGPSPMVEKPKPELLRKLEAKGGDGYSLDQLTTITYAFYKPIEETVDFTVEVSKE